MPQGTLANLAVSAFVRTPPAFAERIVRYLLAFPVGKPTTVLDPTVGEGDLLWPCREIPSARLYGVEISAERASVAHERLPRADIATCAFEGVSIPKASMSLVLANPPYFFQDGKRAEYRILADAGTLLVPGGVLVAILPARSAWDGTMVNHWCRWYSHVRVWKFPDRSSSSATVEGAFEDFTQICVVGIRRAEPIEPSPAEQRRLQGYRYHTASVARSAIRPGWEQEAPPPDLPTVPLSDPYPIPEATTRPQIVVRHADEAQLLAAVEHGGAHLSPLWQAATEWREEGLRESPVMPLSGEAHVAAEVLTGLLDGTIMTLPTITTASSEALGARGASSGVAGSGGRNAGTSTPTAATPYLLTAFVGQEWVALPIDEEEREKLRERGVAHVSARQWQDKPMLGVLNLYTGETRYEQGEAVFTFLHPWLGTLAARVIEERQPLYRLDPADWELRVVAQFGQDKQLPNAPFPGLSLAQQHRVYAMGRALDVTGRTAIQGEPGVGKTRLGIATAARQAYQWRHRASGTLFTDEQEAGRAGPSARRTAQPAWIRGLRQAWLKNPRTLALLSLTPVREPQSGRILAYRHADGRFIAPEEAGPRALPVLVSTPKKVTKEYAQEIRAAWPEAEVMSIAHQRDITRWLAQCATSTAPCVVGIVSHSLSRAFGRAWQPVVRERQTTVQVPVLEPDKVLLSKLEPIHNARGALTGYRWKASGELYTRESVVSHFFCPDCGTQVQAAPGKLHEVEARRSADEDQLLLTVAKQTAEDEEAADDSLEAVTSRTWFTLKPRWCRCRSDARNRVGPRNPVGRRRVRAPLWTDARLEATQRKQPQLSFAGWHAAVHATHSSSTSSTATRPAQPSPRQAVSLTQLPDRAHTKARIGDSQQTGVSVHPAATTDVVTPCAPLPDSFAPCDYLYHFYRGCVALTIVDESHNGRGRDTDIAHAHHQAMLSAQTRMLTSGTHFGGDLLGFFHYWFRFHPQFWRRLGLGWNDAEKALERYGVVQEFTKEYESDARRGSGQTSVQVSTIPAPGISAKLIPSLLEDLVYLTVLDVGAHMPPRIEIPEIVSMRDSEVEEAMRQATQARKAVSQRLERVRQQHAGETDEEWEEDEEEWQDDVALLELEIADAVAREQEVQAWVQPRHLSRHYSRLVHELDELSKERNTAARLAKGTVPRWFATLPCDRPFEVWQTPRDRWGDALERRLLVTTETLAWEHRYPMERRLRTLVEQERAEGRRVMLYYEQNDLRSMARRLEWVLADLHPWTLPNSVPAEERQQAIVQAVQQHGHSVLLVPYRRVNEGLNLQSAVDSIVWVEMALNLFMLDQASRRAWRLGKREGVRIYYLAYANTAGHHKLRKLGQQSGAAAAFAGEPARGALIEHAGANRTTLARLSSLLEQHEHAEAEVANAAEVVESATVELVGEREVEQEATALKAVFAQRAEELRVALARGRTWLGGLSDTLAERLVALRADAKATTSVWATPRPPVALQTPQTLPLVVATAPVLEREKRRQETVRQDAAEQRERLASLPVTTSVPLSTSVTLESITAAVPTASAARGASAPRPSESSAMPPVVAGVIGSRAQVIFGRSDHIALARTRRASSRRRAGRHDPVPRRQPVAVREIAALVAPQGQDEQLHALAVTRRTAADVVTPSLWDSNGTPEDPSATAASRSVPMLTVAALAAVQPQTSLWH